MDWEKNTTYKRIFGVARGASNYCIYTEILNSVCSIPQSYLHIYLPLTHILEILSLFNSQILMVILFIVQFFRRFHSAYVDAVSNPFHVPGKKITSKTFAERVSGIVKSFGSGTSA